jgi:hypothetical protein
MIRLRRGDLREMAEIYIVANTPRSLFDGLLICGGVDEMRRKATPSELSEYFDKITSRAKRTEISMSLAYGVLIALILNRQELSRPENIDPSRLQWGTQIQGIANAVNTPTQIIEAKAAVPESKVTITSTPGASLILPRGRGGAPWENR